MSLAPPISSPTRIQAIAIVLGAIGLAGYAATHPIPGTGALRTLFLLVIVMATSYQFKTSPTRFMWPKADLVSVLLLCLTGWLVIQSSFIASDTVMSLKTLTTEWGKVLLVALIGISLAASASSGAERKVLIVGLFAGFFFHVLSTLGLQMVGLFQDGHLRIFNSFFGSYGYVSPLVDAALAILLADTAGRICFGGRLLPITNAWLGIFIGLALAAVGALAAKGSALVVLGMGCSVVWVITLKRRNQARVITLSICDVVIIAGAINLALHKRWAESFRAVETGVAVTNNNIWPKEEDARAGDGSVYIRAAWAKIGLDGIAAHPLGLGYGTDAFGRYVKERYGVDKVVSSHSGWIDFALANGIPGLILLLGLGFALARQSWRAFCNQHGAGGLALAFLSFCYLFRCLIDGHLSSSRLMGFALVAGLLWQLGREGQPQRDSLSA
jgi:hypothetical protein